MKKIFFLLACFFFFQNSYSQQLDRQVFSSNGTSINSGNIWLDYTIGEMNIVTYTTGSIVLNQGFHQVYSTSTSILNLSYSSAIKVYPNPGSGYLQIDIPDDMVNKSFYKLTDIAGRVISDYDNLNTLLPSNKNTINISGLPYGIYLLTIQTQNSNSTYLYRIIKI